MKVQKPSIILIQIIKEEIGIELYLFTQQASISIHYFLKIFKKWTQACTQEKGTPTFLSTFMFKEFLVLNHRFLFTSVKISQKALSHFFWRLFMD